MFRVQLSYKSLWVVLQGSEEVVVLSSTWGSHLGAPEIIDLNLALVAAKTLR